MDSTSKNKLLSLADYEKRKSSLLGKLLPAIGAFIVASAIFFILPLIQSIPQKESDKTQNYRIHTLKIDKHLQTENQELQQREKPAKKLHASPTKMVKPELDFTEKSKPQLSYSFDIEQPESQLNFDVEFSNTPLPFSDNTVSIAKPLKTPEPKLNELVFDKAPRIRSHRQPVYPYTARMKGITGYVDVDFTINASGYVENIKIKAESPKNTFSKAAGKAVKKWRFHPATKAGKAVVSTKTIRLNFKLDN